MSDLPTQSESILTKGTNGSPPQERNSTFFTESAAAQIKLCEALTAKEGFDDVQWVQSATAYLKKYDRFRYAEISNFVYTICQEVQQEANFNANLDSVYHYIQQRYDRSPEDRRAEFRRIVKFYDHVNLALHQSHLVSSSGHAMKDEVKKEVEQATTKATEGILSQLVGLIAIFTALSFVLFGGISSLQSIFDFLGDTLNAESRWFSILPPIIVALLWCFCMVNLLFIFVLFILRIANRPLHDGERNPFSGRMTTLEALRRFPILIILDYGLFVVVSLLAFVYMAAVSDAGSEWLLHLAGRRGQFIFSTMGFLLLLTYIGAGAFIYLKILNLNDRKSEENNTGKTK